MTNTPPLIVKLGGSIITEKRSGRPRFRRSRVRALARELKMVRSPVILLHGAGSFGHPLVHRYKLLGRRIIPKLLPGVAATMLSVRTLSDALATECHAVGLPVMPLQTSALASVRTGRLVLSHRDAIVDILARGGIPLLGGDIVIDDRGRAAIISADALAVSLARTLGARRILFLSDIPGVFPTWPPAHNTAPLKTLSQRQLRAFTVRQSSPHARDVTGGMIGKLQALKQLRHCTVAVMDGREPGALRKALRGGPAGTTIVFP